jgi:subtilisin family serine protease
LLAADFVPGELLIQYDPNMAPSLMAANQKLGVEVLQEIDPVGKDAATIARIKVPAGKDMMAFAQEFGKTPGVLSAEPNWILKKAAVSNDPYYTTSSRLWGMYSDDSPLANGPAGTTNSFGSGAEEAWGAGYTGSSQVVIGVVDEGIDINHPDLAQNIWLNTGDAPDGLDNDGNGKIDDVNGWDFFSNDNTVYDGTGDDHGTHVAGTIGAIGNNGTGVAGVAWNVKMISAKFLGPTGGSTSGAIQAIDYLTDLKLNHGVNIVAINNSWGGGGYSSALHASIIRAAKARILFIAAAGNSTSNNDTTASYPSNYSTLSAGTSGETPASYESVIAVASINSSGGLSTFSSYGSTQVDIGAPGESINSTLPGNTYGNYSGTSMATPHVTGAVAVIAAAKPTASAAAIRDAILGSAVPTASLAGKTVTGGRLSLLDAINYSPVPKLSVAGASRNEGNSGTSSLVFTVSLTAPATENFSVPYATSNGTATAGSDYTAASGTLNFLAGETSKTISVDVIGDTSIETNETLYVDLGTPSTNAVQLLTSRATGTIQNDDNIQISINDPSAIESAGMIVFNISLNMASTSSISVRVATANGTARAGKTADYTSSSATITFSPGQTLKTFSVPIRNDTVDEVNEFFYANLSNATGAVIADAQGIGTIEDNDGLGGAGGFSPSFDPDSMSGSDWLGLLDEFGRRRSRR